MKKFFRLSTIVCLVITAVFAWLLNYLMLPAWNLRAGSLYGYLVIVMVFASIVFLVKNLIIDELFEDMLDSKIIVVATGIILVIGLILLIVNGDIVNANRLREIPTVNEGNFEEDYVEISNDPAEAFTLDLDSAERLGNRAVGNIKNITWYEVNGEFNLITYQGNKYRLSPLEYGGFFKYLKARDSGIPGYILVNDDTLEATFVQTEEPIRYSPSACFGKNLKRHLRNQYPTYVFETSIFEINEEGHAYWITGVTEPQASLYAGRVMTKVILTDACSGQSEVYMLSETPEWVDHVYDLDYLMQQAKWHYHFVNGFWNTYFSKTDMYETSYEYRDKKDDKEDDTANFFGYNSFINKSGQTVFVTGITPANATESNAGFITMNTRTGEIRFYKAEGAEESSAQQAAESKMQNYGYRATYPVFVNVGGQPTYMMALKDKAGIIQAYGFVSLKNYSITCVDKDIEVALAQYKEAMGMGEGETATIDESSTKEVKGTIDEIYSQVINGTTYYYYVVGSELYKASATVNEYQFLYKVGQTVEIKYYETSDVRTIISIK